jgi:hypothetical protein
MHNLVGIRKLVEAQAFDDASRPELIVDQERRVRFDGPNRMMVVPVSGAAG